MVDRPLGSQRLLRSRDVEQLQQTITSVTSSPHTHALVGEGETVGDVAGVRFDRFGIASIAYSGAATITTDPIGDRLVIIVPLGPMAVEADGERWSGAAPFLLGRDTVTEFQPAPGLGGLAVSFDPECVAERLADLGLRTSTGRLSLGAAGGPHQLNAADAVRASVLEACRLVDDGSAADALTEGLMESLLISAVTMGLRDQLERPGVRVPGRRYVDEAMAVIEQRLAEPLTVEALAREVSVSPRHLHAMFVEYLGLSPSRVLLARRLERARRLLTDPAEAGALSVTAAAQRSGFRHLGRFAATYAERYGEQPSVTLAATVGGR